MPAPHPYADGYLTPLITPGREDRAVEDVAMLGALPEAWVDRLIVLRAYVITCQECQKAPDDTFAAKLATYRKEYADALAQARAAQAATATPTGGWSFFSVPLERG